MDRWVGDARERRGGREKEVEVHGWRYKERRWKRRRVEWVGLCTKPSKATRVRTSPENELHVMLYFYIFVLTRGNVHILSHTNTFATAILVRTFVHHLYMYKAKSNYNRDLWTPTICPPVSLSKVGSWSWTIQGVKLNQQTICSSVQTDPHRKMIHMDVFWSAISIV